ncbi:MAG: Pr6Pr family membrane protein [Actinomycetota bacterium]|nr:Pr6Pr family membrane protein [Actinomycetota bacterium]
MSAHPESQGSTTHRWLFGANALLAWLGLAIALLLTILGTYPNTNTIPTLYGFNEVGSAGLVGRVLDFFSYFTILSNIVVAVVATLLWRNPNRKSGLFRVLRLDSLIMITVTGLVYAIILAPKAQLQGWEYVSNTLEHYITPVLTVLVFILIGPRGLIRVRTIFLALILPLLWVAYSLLRGAVIDSYPYGFLDAARYGYGTVMINLIGIVGIGTLFGFIFLGIEKLIGKRASH